MRWKVTCCMWGGKWRKIMENEENKGIINKKASENSFFFSVWTFSQFSFGALSFFFLSHTLRDLEFSWSTLGGCGILGFLQQEGKAKEEQESSRRHRHQGKGRARKRKKASTSKSTTTSSEGIDINNYIRFYYRYQVACMRFPGSIVDCLALQFNSSQWDLNIKSGGIHLF